MHKHHDAYTHVVLLANNNIQVYVTKQICRKRYKGSRKQCKTQNKNTLLRQVILRTGFWEKEIKHRTFDELYHPFKHNKISLDAKNKTENKNIINECCFMVPKLMDYSTVIIICNRM